MCEGLVISVKKLGLYTLNVKEERFVTSSKETCCDAKNR